MSINIKQYIYLLSNEATIKIPYLLYIDIFHEVLAKETYFKNNVSCFSKIAKIGTCRFTTSCVFYVISRVV